MEILITIGIIVILMVVIGGGFGLMELYGRALDRRTRAGAAAGASASAVQRTVEADRVTPRAAPAAMPRDTAPRPLDLWWTYVRNAPLLIISGESGSGKTTLLQALVADLTQQSFRLLLVDPHAKLGEWGAGIRPIAAGRRFAEAHAAFAWAVTELDRRYKARADQGLGDFPPIAMIADEFDLFTDDRPDVPEETRKLAAQLLAMMGDESRKVNFRLITITHGTGVGVLNLKGKSEKRKNYLIIRLAKGIDEQPLPVAQMERDGQEPLPIATRRLPQLAARCVLEPDDLIDLDAGIDGEAADSPPADSALHEVIRATVAITADPAISNRQLALLLWPDRHPSGDANRKAKAIKEQVRAALDSVRAAACADVRAASHTADQPGARTHTEHGSIAQTLDTEARRANAA